MTQALEILQLIVWGIIVKESSTTGKGGSWIIVITYTLDTKVLVRTIVVIKEKLA